MYKLTRPDGFDFYSGTINYRDAIGSTIRVLDYDPPEHGPCGRGLHASRNPNDCFMGASIPCAAFQVVGRGKLAGDKLKSRYKALKVVKEIANLDDLFGWKYSEAINPIDPTKIEAPVISEEHIALLEEWISVQDSVQDSVRSSVRDSVRDSVWSLVWSLVWSPVWSPVWDSVRDSVQDSVRDSVWDSVRDSVQDSVRDSVRSLVWSPVRSSVQDSITAYTGSIFTNIKTWQYMEHVVDTYPFQSAVDLWKQGIVPSFDGKIWRLHGWKNGRIKTLFEKRP